MMDRILTIGATIVCLATIAQAQEIATPTATYKQYLEEVINTYPQLKRESARVEEAIAQRALAASQRLPNLWVSTQYAYGNDPVYVFGSLLKQNRFTQNDFAIDRLNKPKSMSDHSVSLGGEWVLFDFSQTIAKVKSADYRAQSSAYEAQAVKMEAVLAASEIYSRLAFLQQFVDLVRDESKQSQNDILSTEKLNQEGLQLGPDFYSARMQQSQLTQLLADIQARLVATQMVFNILRGAPAETPVKVELDFNRPIDFSGTAEDWQTRVMEGRLDLKALDLQLKAQGYLTDAQRKSLTPQISAFGSVSEHAKDLTDEGRDSYLVGVKAKMDLFDPGYRSRIKTAEAQGAQLKAQMGVLRQDAAQSTIEYFYQIQTLQSEILSATAVYQDAQNHVQLTTSLYDHGRATVAQSIASRLGLINAFERLRKAQSYYRQEILNLNYFAGQLTPEEAQVIYGP